MFTKARRSLGIGLSLLVSTLGAVAITAAAPPTAAFADSTVGGLITRSEVISRAQFWVGQDFPYSQEDTTADQDGLLYRTDCSGFVSMALHISPQGGGPYTGTLPDYATVINKDDLKPGDFLLTPIVWNETHTKKLVEGHVILFESWSNPQHTAYNAYEVGAEPTGATHDIGIAYPHGNDSRPYTPYRYDHIIDVPEGDVYHAVISGGAWSGFSPINGDHVAQIADVSDGAGNTHALAIQAGKIYQSVGNYTTHAWSPWMQVPNSGGVTAVSAAMDTGHNQLHVFAVVGGAIYENVQNLSNGSWWSSWVSVPNSGSVTAMAAAMDPVRGDVHVFAVVGGVIYESVKDPTYLFWTPWTAVPNSGDVTTVAATVDNTRNELHLLAVSYGVIFRATEILATGYWGPWINVPDSGSVTAVSATINGNGSRMLVFALVGGSLFTSSVDRITNVWTGWAQLYGGTTAVSVACTTSPNGDIQLTAVY